MTRSFSGAKMYEVDNTGGEMYMKRMDEIDKKLSFTDSESRDKLDFYDIPNASFTLTGVKFYGEEGFLRMPLRSQLQSVMTWLF